MLTTFTRDKIILAAAPRMLKKFPCYQDNTIFNRAISGHSARGQRLTRTAIAAECRWVPPLISARRFHAASSAAAASLICIVRFNGRHSYLARRLRCYFADAPSRLEDEARQSASQLGDISFSPRALLAIDATPAMM